MQIIDSWTDIIHAPRDGTRLLLWDGEEINVGYWSTSLWLTRPADSPLGKADGAWIIYRNDTTELKPSHWMPLPYPPVLK